MHWISEFYSVTGSWWGLAEGQITDRDHARVATVHRLRGDPRGRVLDLGSSYGNTAAAFALAGHDVIGVEISDRIDFTGPNQAAVKATPGAGTIEFRKQDFYEVTLAETVDVVTYWNGFGVGDDVDQRRLLRRMANDWLTPDGVVIMTVFNPACWIGWAGDEEHRLANPDAGYPFDVSERTDFDPVRSRFIDTWWRTEDPSKTYTQSQRCYAPADLRLLLEGTGLEIAAIEAGGVAFDDSAPSTSSHPLWSEYEYVVKLVRT